MAYYLVQAKPIQELLGELRQRLDSGEISIMRPFGRALQYSLDNARIQENGVAIWEEEDYCVPALAQERAAILDTYFTELQVDGVEKNKGWGQIELLPTLWQYIR
jgi:hypothetical protein